jgi:hypothetical protein
MRVNISNLADVLDEAAPGRKLAAAIKSEKDRIERDLDSKHVSLIKVDGTSYRIVRNEDVDR